MNAETWKVCEDLLRLRLKRLSRVSRWMRQQELPEGLIVHLVDGLTWPGTRREEIREGKAKHVSPYTFSRSGGLRGPADLIPDPSYVQLDRRGESLGSQVAINRVVTRVFRNMEGDAGRFLVLIRQLSGIYVWLEGWKPELNTKAALRAIVTEHIGEHEPAPEQALLAELALEGLS